MGMSEKYIKFVAAQLVKGTVVDVKSGHIGYADDPKDRYLISNFKNDSDIWAWDEYLIHKYGVRDIEEVTTIIDLYNHEMADIYADIK